MDPFEQDGFKDEQPAQTEGRAPSPKPPKRGRLKGSRRITYAAAAAAIGTICSVIAVYLPVKVMPLVVTAFCCYVVFDRCGWSYGFIAEAAVLLMTFFVSGAVVNVTFFMLALVFVPYAPLAYVLRKLRYRAVRPVLLRSLVMAVFVNAAFFLVYLVVTNVVLTGLDIGGMIAKAGGYWVIALLLVPIAISIDFLFTEMTAAMRKFLK